MTKNGQSFLKIFIFSDFPPGQPWKFSILKISACLHSGYDNFRFEIFGSKIFRDHQNGSKMAQNEAKMALFSKIFRKFCHFWVEQLAQK